MNLRLAALLLLFPLVTQAQVTPPPVKPAWTFLQPVPTFPNPNNDARVGKFASYRADNPGDVVCFVTTRNTFDSYIGTQLLWISPLGKLILKKEYQVLATFGVMSASPSGITISITVNGGTTLQHFQRTANGIKQTESALSTQSLVQNNTLTGSFDPIGFLLVEPQSDLEANYSRVRVQRFR
jgi:hypothetical protein